MLAFFLGILISVACADPQPPQLIQGIFKYRGQYEVQSTRLEQLVNTESEEGKRKLKQRIADGFSCLEIQNLNFHCHKDIATQPNDQSIKDVIEYDYSDFILNLYKPLGVPKLEFWTDDYKMWSVEQKAVCDTVIFKSVNYIENQGMKKLSMESSETGVSFYFGVEGDRISVPRLLNLKQGEFAKKVFVQVYLEI